VGFGVGSVIKVKMANRQPGDEHALGLVTDINWDEIAPSCLRDSHNWMNNRVVTISNVTTSKKSVCILPLSITRMEVDHKSGWLAEKNRKLADFCLLVGGTEPIIPPSFLDLNHIRKIVREQEKAAHR